jgi:hypothetical protein
MSGFVHEAAVQRCPLYVGSQGVSGNVASATNSTLLTHLCHSAINFTVMHNGTFALADVLGFGRLI